MSVGRRPGLCHAETAVASVCVQEKGRWTPGSGGSDGCRNHRSVIRQGVGGGEREAESSLLPPSSMSEKFESPTGWDRN